VGGGWGVVCVCVCAGTNPDWLQNNYPDCRLVSQIGYFFFGRFADWLFRLVIFFSADLQIGYSDWFRIFPLKRARARF